MAERARGRQFSRYRVSLQLSMKNREFPVAAIPSAAVNNRRLIRRGRGLDRERVDVGFHQIVDRGIDQPVAGHGGHAAERLGHDA